MPKFSIIVGVYNQLETLRDLVRSLNEQTFKDFEVHFCDDGSDDGSVEFINDFDGRIARGENWTFNWTLHRQEHKGMRLARNLNQGVAAAKGEYCVFVMADSMLESDYLETLKEYAQPDRIVCGLRIQIDKIDGKIEGVDLDWRVKKGVIPEFPAAIISMPWLCLTGNGLTIPTAAMRAYGAWDESLEGYGGEDNEIIARMYYRGLICWSVPDLRLYHRWHKSQEPNQASVDYTIKKLEAYAR